MKILNLYAGIGGNRKLWPDGHEITAVEIDSKIAAIYQKNFPNDTVIIADAHQYLLDHYNEYDFIWSSPPCPTHSRTNTFLHGQGIVRYPDMQLYQEIIFLAQWCKCKWVVENVISYYDPLIKPVECGRHYFWSNFLITTGEFKGGDIGTFNRDANKVAQIKFQDGNKPRYGFSLKDVKDNPYNKRQILHNLVNPKIGLHVFNCAFKIKQITLKAAWGGNK